jgi:hypothetical protein
LEYNYYSASFFFSLVVIVYTAITVIAIIQTKWFFVLFYAGCSGSSCIDAYKVLHNKHNAMEKKSIISSLRKSNFLMDDLDYLMGYYFHK